MAFNFTHMTITALFQSLGDAIKEFSEDLDKLVTANSKEASSTNVKEIIKHLEGRAYSDKAEEGEAKEIVKVMKQLLNDEELMEKMKLETKEWMSLISVIERRMEMHKDSLDQEDEELLAEMEELTDNLRESIRENE